MLPFKKLDETGQVTDEFEEGTIWDDVYNLYCFDRKLRLLLFDAIERIEIALRTQIIYQLSHKYGSHWQNNAQIFRKNGVFQEIQNHIGDQLKSNRKAQFIEHYLKKYDDPPTPPSWMSIELLYFNELSKICKNLKCRQDRVAIAKSFGLPDDAIFCSWLHAINYVRNICAHHARLWNIKLAVPPGKFYAKGDKVWLTDTEVNTVQSSKLYYFLCIVLYLLQTVNPRSHFKKHFFELLHKYPVVAVKYMGFPEEWEKHPLWQI
jgi:abortive infection bacteriophage resistance protein